MFWSSKKEKFSECDRLVARGLKKELEQVIADAAGQIGHGVSGETTVQRVERVKRHIEAITSVLERIHAFRKRFVVTVDECYGPYDFYDVSNADKDLLKSLDDAWVEKRAERAR